MSEIIETLQVNPANGYNFTVNTAVNEVLLNMTLGVKFLENPSTFCKFQDGDNITFLSAGFLLPYSFGPSLNLDAAGDPILPWTQIQAEKKVGGAVVPLPGIPAASFLPFANYEYMLGVFSPVSSMSYGEVRLLYTFARPIGISMVNVPAALNTLVLPVIPWVKILHNLPLLAW